MAVIIQQQNKDLLTAWWKYDGRYVTDNKQLASAVQIEAPEKDYQDYVQSDIRVKVI